MCQTPFSDAVFSEQVGNILKKDIQMPGKISCFRSGGLTKKIIYSPDANGIITIKGKGRSIRRDVCAAEITRCGAKPV